MKKMYGVVIAVLLTLLCALPALAIELKLIPTCDYAYPDKCMITSGTSVPAIPRAKSVLKNEYFTVLLYLSNFNVDPNHFADVTYDFQILTINRKVYFESKDLTGLHRVIPNPNTTLLAEKCVKFCFKADDEFGVYIIMVHVKDNISGETKSRSISLGLNAFDKKQQFENDRDFINWMSTYYLSPTPEKAVDAFIYFTQNKLSESQSSYLPIFSFFMEIFNNNPYLIPYLLDQYSFQSLTTKTSILALLRYGSYDADEFMSRLNPKEVEIYQKLQTQKLPDPYGEITDPSQLDMLWGIFLASGSYKPIKKLVDTLSITRNPGSLEINDSSDSNNAARQKELYEILYNADKWSLQSNIYQHRLVRDYCNYIKANEPLSKTVRADLEELLK